MRVDRRRLLLLAAAAGCLVGRPVRAASMAVEAGRPLAVMHRWPTRGNRLAPLALDGAQLAFAGESTLGIIRLAGFEETSVGTVGLTWQQAHGLSGGAAFRPRFGGDLVVCGGPAGLAAWEIATGRPRWRYPARVQVGVPFVAGQRVYCGDGHEIVALDLDSGRPLWRFSGTTDTLASYAPAGVGDQVFAGLGDGRLYALSSADGTPLWLLDRRADWQYLRHTPARSRKRQGDGPAPAARAGPTRDPAERGRSVLRRYRRRCPAGRLKTNQEQAKHEHNRCRCRRR